MVFSHTLPVPGCAVIFFSVFCYMVTHSGLPVLNSGKIKSVLSLYVAHFPALPFNVAETKSNFQAVHQSGQFFEYAIVIYAVYL